MFGKFHSTFFSFIFISIFILTGCSGSGETVSPDITDGINSNSIQTAGTSHGLWGFWWIQIDQENDSVEIIPTRQPTIHANVRQFLEDAPCTDCISIPSIIINPDGTRDMDVRLSHPWPGLDTFTGFDVRAIAMWNGSETWPASGLITQDPDSTDGYILNADGYTTIFNPTDFPPGWSMPIFEYSQGKFATPTFPNSTLNPYIDYYTDSERRVFAAGQALTKTWTIKFPSGGPFVLGYAVDASWELPDPNPPVNIPEDFSENANKPEPYIVSVTQPQRLGPRFGDSIQMQVRCYDWQSNPGGAWIECPDLWEGKAFEQMVAHGPEYTIFYVPITNENGAVEGEYRALIGAHDSSTSPVPYDNTTYKFFNIEVGFANNPPVADAEASSYSVVVGENIDFTSLSTDPDGPADIIDWKWDFDNDDFWDSFDENPPHAYAIPGIYFVDHQVTDTGALSDDLEPDDLLEIHVGLNCCLHDPVAAVVPFPEALTFSDIEIYSDAFDLDGVDCIELLEWDTDYDGFFDQQGWSMTFSTTMPDIYTMTHKVTNTCDLFDSTDFMVPVHVGVTLPDDENYRSTNTRYTYISGDFAAADVETFVPVNNPDGPWDFTQLDLADIGNHRAVLAKEHSECASFANDFAEPFTHFYKTEGIFNFVEGAVYVAERFDTDPDMLVMVGMHEDVDVGSANFLPPLELPYPYWVFSSVYYVTGIPLIFEFTYDLQGWGEGLVNVPYLGSYTPCFVVKYEVILDSIALVGSGLVYEWILDDGTVVAVVAAINSDSEINYDTATLTITGTATYNALSTIEPY